MAMYTYHTHTHYVIPVIGLVLNRGVTLSRWGLDNADPHPTLPSSFHGVVFIDEDGSKKILLRQTQERLRGCWIQMSFTLDDFLKRQVYWEFDVLTFVLLLSDGDILQSLHSTTILHSQLQTSLSPEEVLNLADCGIPAIHRFAFYDQVHTTGMDIQQHGTGGPWWLRCWWCLSTVGVLPPKWLL